MDRLWPRGISKDRAQLDRWCKDVAPSTELRELAGQGTLTLLSATKDVDRSEAAVLAEMLR